MKFKNRQTSQFQQLLDDINSFPTWVKEAVFLSLKGELDPNTIKTLKAEDSIFLYVPKLTKSGAAFIKDCQTNKVRVDQRLYYFLMAVQKETNLFDIAQDNNATFHTICRILISGWKNGFIQPTYSKKIHSMVYFLADKIKIGEYLFRIGRMNKQQFHWYTSVNKAEMQLFEDQDQSAEDIEATFIKLGLLSAYELNYLKTLHEFSKSNVKIKSPSLVLLDKIKKLNEHIHTLNDTINNLQEEKQKLFEEKDHYVRKIQSLTNDIQRIINEKNSYIKEISYLKKELQKYLK